MAGNTILKWCKTKLMNGYKHINVEAGEEFGSCSRSDTETLVQRGSAEEEFLLSSPIPPSPSARGERDLHCSRESYHTGGVHHGDARPSGDNTAFVEEVTCDLSLSSSRDIDKQEFAFTLYDFDGHGKITKDDISNLVQTIYEAVGSSLSLPPCGSRTIRVKLTVVPEVGQNPSLQRDDDGLLKDSPRSLQEPSSSPLYTPRGIDEVEVASTPGRSPREGPEVDDVTASRRVRRRRGRRRTSLHRQELLEIIQANMEKNNLFYPPFHHRHYPPHHQPHNHRRRRQHHCSCHCTHQTNHIQPQINLTKESCECQRVSHTRSRSQDNWKDSPHVFRHHLLDTTTEPLLPPSNTPDRPTSPKTIHQHHHNHLHPKILYQKRSRSCQSSDNEGGPDCPEGGRSLPPGTPRDICDASSPPQQNTKHKPHRQVEHARAMSQVVNWLQRSSFKDRKGGGKPHELNAVATIPTSTTAVSETCGHTHHVHQHYHHHYHHYPSTPPLII